MNELLQAHEKNSKITLTLVELMGGENNITNPNNVEEESKSRPKIKSITSPKGYNFNNGINSVRSTYKPIYVSTLNSSNPIQTRISITNRLNSSQTPKNK
jgi:hypothetical protein